MADDDDDDSFGDFAFASNQTTANFSSQIPVTTSDDDDWGEFSYIGNNNTDHNLKSPEPQAQTQTPPKWEKIQGALPLSLFGGEEDEEEDEKPVKPVAGDDVKQSRLPGNNGFASNNNNDKSNAHLGINDLIANLYGPRPQQTATKAADNGNGLDFTARNSTTSKDPLAKSVSFSSFSFHTITASMNRGSDDEGGWEYMDAYSESKLAQNGKDNKERSEKIMSTRSLQEGSHGPNDLFRAPNNGSSIESHVNNGFSSKPITNIQNGFTADKKFDSNSTKNDLNSNPVVENADIDDSFGDFETAFMEQPSNKKEVFEGNNSFGLHDASNKQADLFSFPNGDSHKENNGFDFKQSPVVQNSVSSDPFSQTEWDKSKDFPMSQYPDKMSDSISTKNDLNTNPPVKNVDIDDSFGDFETAFMEQPSNKKEVSEGNNSFGLHDSSNKQSDLFSFPNGDSHKENNGYDFKQSPVVQSSDDENFGKFEMSFQESVSKAQEIEPSPKSYKEPVPLSIFGIEEEPEVDNSLTLQHELFKSSHKHTRTLSSNLSINDILSDLYSQSEPISANVVNDNNDDDDKDDDFDNGSWEFKDASFQSKSQYQDLSFEEKLNKFTDFYSNLRDELCVVARHHLHALKKAQSSATLAGEEMKVAAIDKEIQDAFEQLNQKDIISTEVGEDDDVAQVISLEKYIKILQEPDFITLDSEYNISRRLSLAESDLQTAIDLINKITTMLKIIKLAPKGNPGNYVNEWSKMISVCLQELKHGTWIWNQLLQKNVHNQILSQPQGKEFVNALGEIYRVVVIIKASLRFYKPWILLSGVDLEGLYGHFKECETLWSNSGLEEVTSVDYILSSIKHIQNLDEFAIANGDFSSQCQLSLLSPQLVPEMKMVMWNGDAYFVTIANLWANLISIEPPNLSINHVG